MKIAVFPVIKTKYLEPVISISQLINSIVRMLDIFSVLSNEDNEEQ